jgi:1-pyrroline-5-carboxylate dehydrogenase
MINAVHIVPEPTNEPVQNYAPGSPERRAIQSALSAMTQEKRELPLYIDGKAVQTKNRMDVRSPHKHRLLLGTCARGGEAEVRQAVEAALRARPAWATMPFTERAAIFLKAADLLAGRYRAVSNAATMLGQSKTVHQAEIDSACELIDFWRFNTYFARQLLEQQPLSGPGTWNQLDYRPLDGFVVAITPFNFTSIAGNLPTSPAIMGNTVVWKPATSAALSAQLIMDVLIEAGLPAGVINLVHTDGRTLSSVALTHPELAGIHFTGSTGTFQRIWATVSENLPRCRTYPRLVGETGGKDFILAHPSADVQALAVAIVRGGFEYQGQKCSAASRVYVPESMWKELGPRLEAEIKSLKMGDVTNFENFVGAVIDAEAYKTIKGYIDYAKQNAGAKVWLGGKCDDSEGYFIEPTLVVADDPKHKLMVEEIFGPVVTLHRYDDKKWSDTLKLVDETSPYALTGAVFARDRAAVHEASTALRFAAGNFYINDKPTGAVVGQQPFGGGRASGTNDKAGSFLNLVRWSSPRAIKETFDPPRSVAYPFMSPDK